MELACKYYRANSAADHTVILDEIQAFYRHGVILALLLHRMEWEYVLKRSPSASAALINASILINSYLYSL